MNSRLREENQKNLFFLDQLGKMKIKKGLKINKAVMSANYEHVYEVYIDDYKRAVWSFFCFHRDEFRTISESDLKSLYRNRRNMAIAALDDAVRLQKREEK